MRKPLTVITVTLSVVCTLKGMSRQSIQRIKSMLLCIVYAMLLVDCRHIQRKLLKCLGLPPYLVACSIQHVLTVLTYPGSCISCFSHIPVFGGKVFLIFPIIYKISHLHNWPIWPKQPFDLADIYLDDIFTHFGGFFSIFIGHLVLKFHWDKTCFFLACIDSVYNKMNYIEITWSVMPKPVYLLTVQEA